MVRRISMLLMLVVAFATAPAAPRLKDTPRPFHPVNLGACWVFDDEGVLETRKVTKVEEAEGATILTVQWSRADSDEKSIETIEINQRGIYRLGVTSVEFGRPLCLLRFPPQADDTWENSIPNPQFGNYKGTDRASGPEKVTVPAGSYMAYRVESVGSGFGGAIHTASTQWYAPGIGLVKLVYNGGKVQALQSFSPGKQ